MNNNFNINKSTSPVLPRFGGEHKPTINQRTTGIGIGNRSVVSSGLPLKMTERKVLDVTVGQKNAFEQAKMSVQKNEQTQRYEVKDNKTLEKRSVMQIKKGFSSKIKDFKTQAKKKIDIDKAFKKAGYKQNDILTPDTVLPENLASDLVELGSGQLNTAYIAQFNTGDGEGKQMIVKFESQYSTKADMPEQLRGLGILPEDSKETARNMCAKALDDIMGWNIVVKTQIGVLAHPKTGKLGVVTAMEKAKGFPALGKTTRYTLNADEIKKYLNAKTLELSDPDTFKFMMSEQLKINPLSVREHENADGTTGFTAEGPKLTHQDLDPHDKMFKEELVKLQLMDSILMSTDRHLGNYFIETKKIAGQDTPAFVGLTAIDNDQLGGLDKVVVGNNSNSMVNLPPQIPSKVCEDILNMNKETVKKALSCCLPKVEIDAAMERLNCVQTHVAKVQANNLQKGEGSLLEPLSVKNSYYMRFINDKFPGDYDRAASGE